MRSLVGTVQAGALGPAQPAVPPKLCSHSDSLGGKNRSPVGASGTPTIITSLQTGTHERKQQIACQVFLCRWLQQHHETKSRGGYKGDTAHNSHTAGQKRAYTDSLVAASP